MKNIQFIFLFIVLWFSSCQKNSKEVFSDDKNDIVSYNLISPKEANGLIKNNPEKYIPIQVSKQTKFDVGHLPNAIQIWRPDYTSDITSPVGGLIPSREKLQLLIQSFGFEQGDTLILYDTKANVDACRFAWTLSLYGFEDYKIMNGGLEFWKQEGFGTSTKIQEIADASDFQLPNMFKQEMIADKDDVMNAIEDLETLLIDTRETYEFMGRPFVKQGKVLDYKAGAYCRGSIPTAIHHNWSMMADLEGDHRIKSEKDLRHDLNEKGITPDKKFVLYCQSGSRTSHSYYVLKHVLGYENVKNYDGSWIEWTYLHSQDDNIPVHKALNDKEFDNYKNTLTVNQ